MLDRLYCAFDALAEKYGVYKIDTIGDGARISLETQVERREGGGGQFGLVERCLPFHAQ